jgi:hypothetical protein
MHLEITIIMTNPAPEPQETILIFMTMTTIFDDMKFYDYNLKFSYENFRKLFKIIKLTFLIKVIFLNFQIS